MARKRYAPITDNLREWLLPLAWRKGPIVSRVLTFPLRKTWKRGGLWSQDAHRHSFISYRRPAHRRCADGACCGHFGNDHQKALQTPPEDANAFFSLRRADKDAAEKIVSISAN